MAAFNFVHKIRTTLGWDTYFPKTTAAQIIESEDRQFVTATQKTEFANRTPFAQDINGARIMRNLTARHTDVGGYVYGAVKIKLPNSANDSMLNIVIKGYDYYNGAWELIVGGYLYTAANRWHEPSAVCTTSNLVNDKVRFGRDSSNRWCIVIGDVTDGVLSPTVAVESVVSGYMPLSFEGWEVTYETNLSDITFTGGTHHANKIPVQTPWFELVLQNGAMSSPGNPPQYSKDGNIVFLRGEIIPNSTGYIRVASLPDGFRPVRQFTYPVDVSLDYTASSFSRKVGISSTGAIFFGVSSEPNLPWDIHNSFRAEF